MDKEKLEYLQSKALDIRKLTVEMIGRLGVGHIGGALSIVDLLSVPLLRYSKRNPFRPEKSRQRSRRYEQRPRRSRALQRACGQRLFPYRGNQDS